MQSKTKQDGNKEHLQNLTFCKCINHRIRNNVEQEFGGSTNFSWTRVSGDTFSIQTSRVNIHACARLQNVNHHQANKECNRAHNLEIQEGQATCFANLFHVLHPSNTEHNSTKNNGGNHHLDAFNKGIPKGLHVHTKTRIEMPQQNTNHNCCKYLKIKDFIDWWFF